MPIIALMSDFGTRDHYGAAMKGVILKINPKATLVDITHDIGSQDVFHGAFTFGLARGWDVARNARFASAVAALKCRALGGRTGIPTYDEVVEFLDRWT